MSYSPVSSYTLQTMTQAGEVAEGYYLKFYEANTTTPLSMATDATGGTTLVKAKLNDNGMPISNPLDNSTVFIPFMNADYRLVIYLNEADADANDTASSFVNIASVPRGASYADLAFIGTQDCSATFNSNVYTIIPTSGVFAQLEEGLVIEFDLPSGSITTGQAQISYNGVIDDLDWIDGTATVSDDLDDTYTKRLRCRFDGTDWRIVSDVTGNNSNGDWLRKADGFQIVTKSTDSTTAINTAMGSLFRSAGVGNTTMAKSFASIPYTNVSISDTSGNLLDIWSAGILPTASVFGSNILVSATSIASSTFTFNQTATGRWY